MDQPNRIKDKRKRDAIIKLFFAVPLEKDYDKEPKLANVRKNFAWEILVRAVMDIDFYCLVGGARKHFDTTNAFIQGELDIFIDSIGLDRDYVIKVLKDYNLINHQ